MNFSTGNGCSHINSAENDLDNLRFELATVMWLLWGFQHIVPQRRLRRCHVCPFNSNRQKMRFRPWGRFFWPKKSMQQTSGGSWAWALSVTSNRTCTKAGRKSRTQPRKVLLLLNIYSISDIKSLIIKRDLAKNGGSTNYTTTDIKTRMNIHRGK